MASTIGIKIANGEFYSIVEENSPVKKRLVLTTVHDKQRSVQIDLYKSYTRTMADALYIGSLVVENISPRPKGDPSIELVITSAKDGEIIADAVDMDTSVKGEHHTLNVSLKSLEEDNREYEIPDFELEQNETPPTGLLDKASKARQEKKKGFPWLMVICAALLVAAIALAVWLFFFGGKNLVFGWTKPVQAPVTAVQTPQTQTQQAQAEPAPQSEPAPKAQSEPEPKPEPPPPPAPAPAEQAKVQAEVPVIQAPAKAPASSTAAARNRPTPPVASYKVPSVIPKEGAPYKIRWGDTLWDIAAAFYRNPWLYPRIARFNNIRNPDLIISGTTILVPPKN